MSKALTRFKSCERGNIVIMTAGLIMPLLTLVVGGIEYAEMTRIQDNLQRSSDEAVLAAFRNFPKGRRAQQDAAKAYFRANLAHKNRFESVKTKLRRKIIGKNIVLSYSVKTKVKTFFGELNPLGDGTIVVKSTAVYNLKTRRPPHLVSNDFPSKGGRSTAKNN